MEQQRLIAKPPNIRNDHPKPDQLVTKCTLNLPSIPQSRPFIQELGDNLKEWSKSTQSPTLKP